MKVGICGLPQSGKTTVFNALTGADYELHAYGGGAVKVNLETASVADERLDWLHKLESSKKKTPTQIEFLDVAGLGAGEGGGAVAARFISELRRAEALMVVLRAFDDPALPHPVGSLDPLRDLESFILELGVVDLQAVTTRLGSVGRGVDRGDKKAQERVRREEGALERLAAALEAGRPAREIELEADEAELVRGLGLLTMKPLIPVVNVDLDCSLDKSALEGVAEHCDHRPVIVHGRLENEIRGLEPDEAAEFRSEFGVPGGIVDELVRACFEALELHVFFTVGPKEARSWTIRRGATAIEAARAIHSDIARGFIRAEVAAFDELSEHGSFAALKKRGLYRIEGKDYVVADGDVIYFRFQV
ncbi:MAG: redox-regulated ATPase YchF [Candidatus Coatesbacteria bacterium]|nr:redox-regulated ATPase YchF [Candidatus Coatesbacteria bacterium]